MKFYLFFLKRNTGLKHVIIEKTLFEVAMDILSDIFQSKNKFNAVLNKNFKFELVISSVNTVYFCLFVIVN